MARPWRKGSAWPYVAKSGRRSYSVGFYDHEKVGRTRAFPSVRHARAWMDDYITAERRGPDSLRRFLLDLDAKEANQAESRSIGEVIELYLAVNAHPRNQGGLAPSTYERYVSAANRHLLGKAPRKPRGKPHPPVRYAVALASVPAVRFNEPLAPRAWREQMMRDGVSKQTREHAWRVLSAVLGWAAGSQTVPEIQTNGCILANEGVVNRRRSARAGGTGYAPVGRRRGPRVPSWALSPQAVEAIREQLLLNVEHRDPLLAHRDAAIVSMQYGLGARNQEVWAMRWMSLDDGFAWVVEVLSHGQLDEWGKTEYSTQRRAAMPGILQEDLSEWREALRLSGHPARDVDFIIPGDLANTRHGVRDPRTGACHVSKNQADTWGRKFFTPAVRKVAEQPEFFHILGATPYALRRGGISLRLRAEDPQTVASECGTSLQMLSAHYAFAIEDLRQHGPRPVDVEWRAAREARMDAKAQKEDQSADVKGAPGSGGRGRNHFFAWLPASRRTRRE
jgi:integrase